MPTKRASELSTSDKLADGTLILRTSHQTNWFYIQGWNVVTARPIKRRYRLDQEVALAQ